MSTLGMREMSCKEVARTTNPFKDRWLEMIHRLMKLAMIEEFRSGPSRCLFCWQSSPLLLQAIDARYVDLVNNKHLACDTHQ